MQKVCQRCVLDARIELITLVPMQVLRTVESLAQYRDAALVPTMGGLHDGHLSLVRTAGLETGPVVVSIFVNPSQFEPGEDLESYPRDFERDLELIRPFADLVFAPEAETIYPAGFSSYIDVGPVACILEGEARLAHFRGVATGVAKTSRGEPAHL